MRWIVFVLTLFSLSAKAQIRDSFDIKNSVIPIVFYLPETSLGFGGAGILSFRKKSASNDQRFSQILYSANYTLKKQILILFPYEIYSQGMDYRFKGELGFYRYFYNFYGVGGNTQQDVFETYDVVFPRLEFSATRFIRKGIGLGAGLRGDLYNITDIVDNGLLETEMPIGYEGGTKFNFQLLALFDNRDNINSPYRGYFAEVSYQKSLGFLGSDFDYTKWEIDVRHYLNLGKESVLANRLWMTLASEGVPFFDMAHLSTGTRARGISDRRFINPDIYTFQSEVRIPLFGRFRANIFGSYNIIPEERGQLFDGTNVWTYGLGLRYVLAKENRNCLRLDIAKGKDAVNFYLTVNEAF